MVKSQRESNTMYYKIQNPPFFLLVILKTEMNSNSKSGFLPLASNLPYSKTLKKRIQTKIKPRLAFQTTR
ncbi:hypothetical protein Hanom_Chr05g00458601 [Helianthus anomalus]